MNETKKATHDSKGNPVTATVYWDTTDPNHVGWSYRIIWDGPGPRAGLEETGPCDTEDPWDEVVRFLS